jgi:hypothetical protein
MEILMANLQENAVLYGAIAVCAAPLIFLTRKYSVPAILYLVEFVIYACAMHVIMWVLVKVTRWFKEQSSMKALNEDGIPEDAPEWGTPLLEFWDTAAYDPNVIWKIEIGCLVLVLILMWRYRPMKIQRKSGRQTQEYAKGGGKGKKPYSYSRGAGDGKGGKKGGSPSARGTRGR